MIDCNEFLSKYYTTTSPTKQNDVRTYIRSLNNLLGENDVASSLRDDTLLCRSFYIVASSGVSRTNYQKIKTYIVNLFDMYGIDKEVPSREQVLAAQTLKCYWKDLDDLMDFIDKIGENKMQNYNPRTDLITIKAIAVLGWYGFSIEEVTEAKKDGLYQNDSKYLIRIREKAVSLDWRSYDILCRLAFLYAYKGFPSGKLQILKGDGNYLFRPTTSGLSRWNENNVKQALKHFNYYAKSPANAIISFGKLHKNAIFTEVFNDQGDDGVYEKIIRITGCSSTLAQGYRKEYEQWLNICHKEKLE